MYAKINGIYCTLSYKIGWLTIPYHTHILLTILVHVLVSGFMGNFFAARIALGAPITSRFTGITVHYTVSPTTGVQIAYPAYVTDCWNHFWCSLSRAHYFLLIEFRHKMWPTFPIVGGQ